MSRMVASFDDIISPHEQYEVAQARANISWLGVLIADATEGVCNVFLARLDKIHEDDVPR